MLTTLSQGARAMDLLANLDCERFPVSYSERIYFCQRGSLHAYPNRKLSGCSHEGRISKEMRQSIWRTLSTWRLFVVSFPFGDLGPFVPGLGQLQVTFNAVLTSAVQIDRLPTTRLSIPETPDTLNECTVSARYSHSFQT